ncbi:MAG: hypothetical protein RL398_1127 [Planctomycetota bacterium]|jgi:glycosyltransferase involved in cell wall biosynthesis
MNVVFDGICLGDGPITGVARSFLTGLAAYAERFGPCTLLLPRHAADPQLANVAVVKAPRGAVPRQLLLPMLLRELRADLLHSSVAAIPLSARCATIATAHDLPWHHRAEGEKSSWRARLAAERSFVRATAVIAPSTVTADDVRKTTGVDHHKVQVIPHGVALDPNPPTADRRHGPFLALGDDRPRKNRDTVQLAHRLANARAPQLPDLQFVGPPAHYVDEAQKLALLRNCRAAVQCARFEGFGLPALEALAHGAPLVCSDIPSHREIVGDAALRVDPLDASAIADALLRIHRDTALREQLAAAGPTRARRFAPSAVAIAWRQLHEELCR